MRVLHSDRALPKRVDAIKAVTRFTELNARTITDRFGLIRALGGVSAALSSIADSYGRVRYFEPNVGLYTEIGHGLERHRLVVSGQDVVNARYGAHIERSAIRASASRYYRHVHVPTDTVLQRFQSADPAATRPNYSFGRGGLYREDICAIVNTTDPTEPTYIQYLPFHVPTEHAQPEDYPTTPIQDTVSYVKTLQDLSRMVLEVI